ncbi:MAG: ABC transporter permease subunit [Legionellaceae bacterium]|nr:ABC transporter permease subunit [Legionellaceae bacterium]
MEKNRVYSANRNLISRFFNGWDLLLLVLVIFGLFFLGRAGQQMATPYALGQPLPISLDPKALPFYALRTVLRMFIALGFSLLFTFVVGTLAAKNKRAERLIIPMIDVLQSVPVLSFLAITVTGFIHLFPGSLLGPECASIFVIFTAQVWNITLSFYQSVKTVPPDFHEVASMFQLSPWQRFWKVEVPCSLSGLLWNMMMSMSASWFFVVLSEAIAVSHQNIRLPGVGSYIAFAIEQGNLQAIGYAILTMVIVIFLYDQMLFRPLIAWSEKFKLDAAPDDEPYASWFLDWLRKSHLFEYARDGIAWLKDRVINIPWFSRRALFAVSRDEAPRSRLMMALLWHGTVWGVFFGAAYQLFAFISPAITLHDVKHVAFLGLITALRVIVLIILSSLLWIPVGVWVGLRPRWVQKVQPLIQLAAAFPANLFYPLFVIAIVRFHLNVQVWVTPLMILGTQWYILFNVIAGASMIPRDLNLAASNFGVRGFQWWRRLGLPAIFPYYITGAITAAGGAWNASIVAEWVSWGGTTLRATGLGEYIQANTVAGHFPEIALGTAMMCIYVLLFNQMLWRPLYRLAEARFQLDRG